MMFQDRYCFNKPHFNEYAKHYKTNYTFNIKDGFE